MNRCNIDVLQVQFRCSLYGVEKDQRIESKIYLNLSTDQKLIEQIKVISTNQKFRLTDQTLDQKIKN